MVFMIQPSSTAKFDWSLGTLWFLHPDEEDKRIVIAHEDYQI